MDLYVILGLRHGASEGDVKRAYRRLARRYHPDVNPGDRESAERFRQILEAYETLTDPDRRMRYEAGVREVASEALRATGFEGFDFSVQSVDHAATFGDLFAEALGARATESQRGTRGADLHQTIAVSLKEALGGATRVLTVTRHDSCAVCAGTGRAREHQRTCPRCDGSGTVRAARGHMVFSQSCHACGGTGTLQPTACQACAGSGTEVRAEAITVRMAAGAADGDTVRVASKGHAGASGGVPGDLYVSIRVAPDPKFSRQGDDLHVVLPLALHEVTLGARVEIDAPDGPVKVAVPPGTQPGQQVRVRGRGAPSMRTGQRGDLVTHVQVVLPARLDERSQELVREFARLNPGNVRERW